MAQVQNLHVSWFIPIFFSQLNLSSIKRNSYHITSKYNNTTFRLLKIPVFFCEFYLNVPFRLHTLSPTFGKYLNIFSWIKSCSGGGFFVNIYIGTFSGMSESYIWRTPECSKWCMRYMPTYMQIMTSFLLVNNIGMHMFWLVSYIWLQMGLKHE